MFLAQIRLAVERLKAHAAHQRSRVLATDRKPFCAELVPQHSRASKRHVEVQLIEPKHHLEVDLANRFGLVIIGGSVARVLKNRSPAPAGQSLHARREYQARSS